MGAGTGGFGVEASATHAGGDAVGRRPRHGLGVIAVRRDVGELGLAARGGGTGGAPQHGDQLGPGDGAVGVSAVGTRRFSWPTAGQLSTRSGRR